MRGACTPVTPESAEESAFNLQTGGGGQWFPRLAELTLLTLN